MLWYGFDLMMQLSTLFPGLGVGKGKYKSSWQCQNDDINNHPVTENGHCLASFQGRECVQALKCVPGGRNLTFLLGCFSFLSLTVFIGEKDEFLFPNKFPSNLNHCQFWGLTPELKNNKHQPVMSLIYTDFPAHGYIHIISRKIELSIETEIGGNWSCISGFCF